MTAAPARPTYRRHTLVVAVLGMLLGFTGLAGIFLDATGPASAAEPVALPATASPAAPPADPAAFSTSTLLDVAADGSDQPPPVNLTGSPPVEGRDAADRTAEPATREPERVVIPTIDVDADLVELGLDDQGAMELPDFGLAGWYAEGPAPGEDGPAVIVAHVDDQRGPDVFFELERLRPGDEVHVPAADGSTATFIVEHLEFIQKEALPADRIWAPTDEPGLTLITCGGTFDRRTGHYDSNLIVFTSPA